MCEYHIWESIGCREERQLIAIVLSSVFSFLHWQTWNNWHHIKLRYFQVYFAWCGRGSRNFYFLRYHDYKIFRLLVPSNDLGPPWKTIEIIYSPRSTNTPSVKFQYLSLLEISCLKSLITLISSDLKWPPWKTIGIFYSWRTTYIPSLMVKQHLVLKIPCLQGFTRFSDFDLWWPHMTIDLHEKQYKLSTHQVLPTYQVWSSDIICFLRYCVYNIFILWPLVTSNDVWPPWKTIGHIYSHRATYIPSLKVKQHLVLEIPCLQGFTKFSDFDFWWPHMTYDLHEKQYKLSTHQVLPTYQVWRSGNIYFLRYRVYKVSYFALWWPQMTFDLHEKQ